MGCSGWRSARRLGQKGVSQRWFQETKEEGVKADGGRLNCCLGGKEGLWWTMFMPNVWIRLYEYMTCSTLCHFSILGPHHCWQRRIKVD